MGFFDKLFGKKERPAKKGRGRQRAMEDEAVDGEEAAEEWEPRPRERDNRSILVNYSFHYPPEEDYEKNIDRIEYLIDVENNTDYPMGKLRVEFNSGAKLGTIEGPEGGPKLLDAGGKMTLRARYMPAYEMGTEEFPFEIAFFDFKHKLEERLEFNSKPLKVSMPKLKPAKMDSEGFRLLTMELYRWTFESGVMKTQPRPLYDMFKARFAELNFREANENLNEKLFRGISQMVASDDKGRKWAVQIQAIGKGKESKFLLYTYGERPQYAYNLSAKVLEEIGMRKEIMASLEEQ